MKKILVVISFLMLGWSASSAYNPPVPPFGVSFGLFYSSLGSYGEWISVDGGVYAWRPTGVAAGWRPYTVGRWAWTDDGWYWTSDEPWGWAAYHYGRWYYDDYYGWLWIPGYDWAPAWVEWRYGGEFIGWAPLSPYAVFSFSFGIHYQRYWVTPYHYWSFVDCQYITSPNMHRYMYRTEDNMRYIGRTRTAGNVAYEGGRVVTRGPAREYIERRGNVRVERADVVDAGDREHAGVVRSEGKERISVYRPRIEQPVNGLRSERPERVREVERVPSLDTRALDVRSREQDREAGRDLRRAEEYRNQRQAEQRRLEERSIDRGRQQNPDRRSPSSIQRERKQERYIDRPQVPPRRNAEPPRYEQRTPRPERRIERAPEPRRESVERPRMQREEMRSSNPTRVMPRPEARPERRTTDTPRGERRRDR